MASHSVRPLPQVPVPWNIASSLIGALQDSAHLTRFHQKGEASGKLAGMVESAPLTVGSSSLRVSLSWEDGFSSAPVALGSFEAGSGSRPV